MGDTRGDTREVCVAGIPIGGPEFVVIAGPCSVEGREQVLTTAAAVRASGARLLRGGIWKMRTRSTSFQGLGADAVEMVREAKEATGLPFVAEVSDPRQLEALESIVDMFQVGTRSMYNYSLLSELGQLSTPVLLKRAFSARVTEWLHAAEYVTAGGNEDVVLCERGIRTFETVTRNTLDLNAVAWLKANSSLPVVVDPSHGTGSAELVVPMGLAAAAAGADGLIVEVHPSPSDALSDADQALDIAGFSELTLRLRQLLPILGRTFAPTEG